jgi:hypothetical protein
VKGELITQAFYEVGSTEPSYRLLGIEPVIDDQLVGDFISDHDAVESVKHIAAQVNGYHCECQTCRNKRVLIEPCDCVQQGLSPCGQCGTPPAPRR